MKTLFSLIQLIENPLEIYKYDKVILNNSMYEDTGFSNTSLYSYLKKIFTKYNKQYFTSFKYFIKICENIEFQFKDAYDYTIILFINIIIYDYNYDYNKNYKKILIYLIKNYKFIKIYYTFLHLNIICKLNPTNNYYSKLNFKLYKYYKLYH